LTNLNALYISENPITRSINDSILDVLNSNNVNGGTLLSENGRTSAGTSDYNSLISRGWSLTGVDLPPIATFTTSKAVGETIKINVSTTGGYWKYNHNGSDSSLYQDGSQTITVSNANGQFSITAYNSQGNISGNILNLNFENNLVSNQITSIDVTSLTGLTGLNLSNNLLTSFNSTGLSNLTSLNLSNNSLTTFSATGLSSLTTLDLSINQLTSFNGTGMSNLTTLELSDNLINSFNNGNMTSLNVLSLNGNQLTSFDARSLSNLTSLTLGSNLLTSFNGTGLSNLVTLGLQFNQLTSIDTTGLTSLRNFSLRNNQISSFIGIDSLNGLNGLYIFNNPITTSINNSILNKINSNNINGGSFTSVNGRTSEGTTAYNSLISRGWTLIGIDLVIPTPPPVPTRVGIRGNWGGSIWNEPSEPGDYTPNPISENGNWNGGSNGTSGSGGTI
jgi:Leucine-rich repeat (LRR) protein